MHRPCAFNVVSLFEIFNVSVVDTKGGDYVIPFVLVLPMFHLFSLFWNMRLIPSHLNVSSIFDPDTRLRTRPYSTFSTLTFRFTMYELCQLAIRLRAFCAVSPIAGVMTCSLHTHNVVTVDEWYQRTWSPAILQFGSVFYTSANLCVLSTLFANDYRDIRTSAF